MRKLLLIATAGLIGVVATGCDFLSGDETTSEETVVESPVVVSPAPQSPAFSQPTVESKNTPKGILPPDLISSTDPNQRIQQIKGDRSDPFALLPTTPTVQVAPGATPQTVVPAPATRTTTGGAGSAGGAANTPAGRQSSPNRSTASGGSTTRSRTTARTPAKPAPKSPITATSPKPQPDLARAVQVTGVVQVGDKVYAIVNAPNEPTSRYVQAGQRLAGGQVLVRRIETNRAEPVVILEQNGVEVVRAVGEGVPTATNGTPAATLPVPSNPAT